MSRCMGIALLAVAAATGCGGGGSEAAPPYDHAECFDRAGANFADDRSDIGFYFDALRRDEGDKTVVFVDRYMTSIDEWSSGGPYYAGEAPKWALWAAHPLRGGKEPTVSEVLQSDAEPSYVAYVEKPSYQQLEQLGRCINRLVKRDYRDVSRERRQAELPRKRASKPTK